MNQVSIDTSSDTPRVIVVERRSLLSQIGGVWFVALPLIAAYLICRTPYELPESPASSLRLGDNSWLNGVPAPSAVASAARPDNGGPLNSTTAPEVKPDPVPAVVPAAANTLAAQAVEAQPAAPAAADSGPPALPAAEALPQGVVVLDSPRAGTNPVAIFDPEGKASSDAARSENRTLDAALKFDGGQPATDETRQALADIDAEAEKARLERQRTESLKPLIAMHEQAQAKAREAKRAETVRRQAAASREAFLQGLGTILASDDTIPQQGRQIDLLVRRELDQIDFAPFQPVFERIAKMPGSRAGKLRYLLQQKVPEAFILSYLIEVDAKSIGKNRGPRDKDHAIVRSAEFLITNLDGR